jgi:hypothetical protein
MADIDIVPKRRSNTWMWLLLAILIIGSIAWMVMGGTQGTPDTTIGRASPAALHHASSAVTLYTGL